MKNDNDFPCGTPRPHSATLLEWANGREIVWVESKMEHDHWCAINADGTLEPLYRELRLIDGKLKCFKPNGDEDTTFLQPRQG